VKEKWIEFTGRPETWRPHSYSVICQDHFTKNDFQHTGERKRLKRDSFPMNHGRALVLETRGVAVPVAKEARGTGREVVLETRRTLSTEGTEAPTEATFLQIGKK